MPGPTPKPDDRRQRRNSRAVVSVKRNGDRIAQIPDPPDDLLPATVEDWERFWASDVALVLEADSDMPGVRRLFQLYDDHERARRAYVDRPFIEGSQGQPVLNPMERVRESLATEIRLMEDRLGMNPKARLQLGIQMTEARKSLNDLMTGLDPYRDDDDDDHEAKLEAV